MSFYDFAVIFAFFILPIIGIFALNLLPKRIAAQTSYTVLGVVGLIGLATSCLELIRLLAAKIDYIIFTVFWEANAGKSAFFSLDLLSSVMLICVSCSIFCAGLTAKDTLKAAKSNSFISLSLILMLAMNGIVLVNDLFAFYVFLEATSIATFVMVALYKDSEGLEGSFKYFVLSAIATVFILIGMVFILINSGSTGFAAIQSMETLPYETLCEIGVCLLLAGLCIKAGITPFHGWVPDAYQSAPAAVSVILGGSITKICGIYGLIRIFGYILPDIALVKNILLIFSLLAICFGAFAAISQSNFKRILAYSSISQLGYISLGIAIGSPLALVGAIMHFFNHAVFKGTLFVNAAALEKEIGTLDINNMGGLAKQLPVTGISSVLAFLSAAGIPPFSGFWSKVLIIIAAWLAGFEISAAIALMAGLLTMAYFLRLQRKVFFGKSREEFVEIKESGKGYKAAALLMTCFTCIGSVLMPITLVLLKSKGLL